MTHLPIISPDESGDVPRCRKACGSSSEGYPRGRVCVEQRLRVVATGDPCVPRLLQVYAALRWIPVTERLPPSGEPVLVRYLPRPNDPTFEVEQMWEFRTYPDVTHWMPIPRFPR